MRRVVVDANVVISAALKPDSTPALALLAARSADRLAISVPVRAEYSTVLSRPKFAKALPVERREAFLALLLSDAETLEPCRDPGDEIYLELALAAHASWIVSGDDDLLSLRVWRGIPIVTPSLRAGRQRSF